MDEGDSRRCGANVGDGTDNAACVECGAREDGRAEEEEGAECCGLTRVECL